MKDNIKSLLMGSLVIYILFGFFAGAQIKYISPIESSKILAFLDYFIRNFFHLWEFKLIGVGVFVLVARFIKSRKKK
ncbi:hypothetical protein [Tissierella sp.]|uniref:hypothetical protein n=1 Tax=Tissierella sp. TaxID=41274 RepID=UPI00285FBBBA|nr:hypothetical protein [Tissierella sp.]MDR7854975.1 hypothetical protein [Tissierella sp.]